VAESRLWSSNYFAAVMAVLACILWGSAFPVLKLTYAELCLEPGDIAARMLLAGGRFLLAGLMVLAVQRFLFREQLGLPKRQFGSLLLLGTAQTGLQYYFFYNGIALVSGVKGAILNAVGNFFVVIFAHFIYRNDRLNLGKVLGLAAGFGGVALANWQSGDALSWQFSLRGEGFMICSGLTSAFGTFWAKRLGRSLNPVTVNGYQLTLGSLVLLLLGLPVLFEGGIRPTPLFWGLFIYSAFLSAAAFSIWYTLLKYHKAGEITIYRFAIPISGSLLSALLLPGEQLTLSIWAALALVSVGIFAVNAWENRTCRCRGE